MIIIIIEIYFYCYYNYVDD